jgi:dolichol kinase
VKTEILRKMIHIGFGTGFLGMIYYLGTESSFFILSLIFLVGLIISLVIKKGYEISILVKIIRAVERDYERHWPGKAALLFFIATIILLYFFKNDPLIVLAGLSTAIYGDAAAALVGKGIGRVKIGFNNTLEGTLAGFFICLICIGFFFPTASVIIIFLAALVATIAEYLPINDNVAMPLSASATLYFLLLLAL